MLLSFFKKNLPYTIVSVIFLALLIWIPSIINNDLNVNINTVAQTPLFGLIILLFKNNYYINVIVGFLFVLLESAIILKLNFKFIFIEKRTYLPALIFILIVSANPQIHNFNSSLLANLFCLVAINKSFSIQNNNCAIKNYFEAGFFIGIASLIDIFFGYITILIWITMFVLKTRFSLREWFSSIIGLIVPFFCYATILYLNNSLVETFIAYKQILLNLSFNKINFSIYQILIFILIFLISLVSLIFTLNRIRSKKINTRKYFNLFMWLIIILTPFFFIYNVGFKKYIYIIALPLSIVLSMFFVNVKSKTLGEIIFSLLLISIFILNLF